MKDDKHNEHLERKLMTPGKYPRLAQSSKEKEVPVEGSECEEGEGTAHLPGPSLEIGGGEEHLPRVARVQTQNSECEAEEDTTHLSGLSLEIGGEVQQR